MRAALLALALLVASPAAAVTYTQSVAGFEGWIDLYADDGLTSQFDQRLISEEVAGHATAQTQTDFREDRTVGILDPQRVFSGSLFALSTAPTWSNVHAIGTVSGTRASIHFTELSIRIEGDAIACVPVSGGAGNAGCAGSPQPPALVTLAGSVLFGGLEHAFATTLSSGWGSTGRGNPDRIEFGSQLINQEAIDFTHQGVPYVGRLTLRTYAFAPEPGTALLVGLGLAGLSRRWRS